jgi:hypothetical protein
MNTDALQGARETRPELVQLACMAPGKPSQNKPAFTGHSQNRAALVHWVRSSFKETFLFGSVHEFDCAVVLQPQSFGGIRNGDGSTCRCSCDLQQELMLLGMQSCILRSTLAEMHENAKRESEFSQSRKKRVRGASGGLRSHIYIVTRYISNPQLLRKHPEQFNFA